MRDLCSLSADDVRHRLQLGLGIDVLRLWGGEPGGEEFG